MNIVAIRSMRTVRQTCVALAPAALCLSLLVGIGASPAGARDAPAPVAGTPAAKCPTVEAELAATIDTKRAKAGEPFTFTTTTSVTVADRTIAARTRGFGVIETLDHSKSQGHSGYLVLEARFLDAGNDVHIPVALLPGSDGHSLTFVRAGSSDAGLIGYLPFYIGTAAGVYNVFHHGKDAALIAGTRLPLVVGDAFYTGACSVDIDR